MKTLLIRLKNHPEYYIGKESPTYGLVSDQSINHAIQYFSQKGEVATAWDVISQHNRLPYWFVSKKRAKIWTDEKSLRNFVNRYNKGETHSQYEVEVDNNGITLVPLDTFMQNNS